MSEILLETVYDPISKRCLGKVVIQSDDLQDLDLQDRGLMYDMNHHDTKGYKRYRKLLLRQKRVILRVPNEVV